jgi:antitoxin component YwqK of YwqJK toxin-antitoxin module
MKKGIITLITSFICLLGCTSNAQKTFKVIYGNEQTMQLSKNKRLYEFKAGLENGIWIAYYDSACVDSALLVTVTEGQLTGLYKRWHRTKKYVTESGNLKYGKRDGEIYFFLLEDDGKMYVNIERWRNGKFDGFIKEDF